MSVPLLQQEHSNPQVPPEPGRRSEQMRVELGRDIVQSSPELGQKHFLSDPRGQEVAGR